MSQSIVIETQFFPPIEAISYMSAAHTVYIEAQEHYQKRSFRNKCVLVGSNGINQFTVPLEKGKHQQKPIAQVRINYDEHWVSQFLKLCQSNYKSSPYYDYVTPAISTILHKKHKYLFDLNQELLHWINSFLDLDTSLALTTSYSKHHDDLLDYRHRILPHSTSSWTAKAYLQVFQEKHGFIGNVSVLDLLFCCGKESIYYL